MRMSAPSSTSRSWGRGVDTSQHLNLEERVKVKGTCDGAFRKASCIGGKLITFAVAKVGHRSCGFAGGRETRSNSFRKEGRGEGFEGRAARRTGRGRRGYSQTWRCRT
jgi:hypothetical protein